LIQLIDHKLIKRLSKPMQQNISDLVFHSNNIFRDDTVDQKTKNICKELLTKLHSFNELIAKARANKINRENTLKNTLSPSETQALQKEIAAQVKSISEIIKKTPKDMKSLDWLRILGLTLSTLGVGLLWIIPSVLTGGTTFRPENPVANQASRLINEGNDLLQLSKASKDHTSEPSVISG
jgi:hypothetical protein